MRRSPDRLDPPRSPFAQVPPSARRLRPPLALRLFVAAVPVLVIATLLALVSPPARADAPRVGTQAPGFLRAQIGELEVTALSDGTHTFPVDTVMRGASPETLDHLLDQAFLTRPVQGSINAFLINTGARLILVDAGAGALYGPCCGQLVANLRAAGYAPEQVDEVLLTHLHKDHVGGITTPDGERVFPNAVVRMSRLDLAYWTSTDQRDAAPAFLRSFFDAASAALAPYRRAGRLRAIDADGALPELGDGVRAVATPGHTPGHTSYVFESGGRQLIVWGDLVHVAALQLVDPSITVQYDSDGPLAARTRRAVADEAVSSRELIAAAHIAFPGLGQLRRNGAGYDWVPLNYDALGPR